MLGIMLIYLGKMQRVLLGFEKRSNYKYLHRDLQRFIEAENKQYYRLHNVELFADESGALLELQLPDDIDDVRTKRSEQRRAHLKHLQILQQHPDIEEEIK
jgi:hypothetical protein